MKLFVKISLGLLALILIIVLGVAFTFNPNDYKNDIITLVKDKTGRQLSINGDISLSFFPWIGLDLGEINISNAKGFGNKPFAKMSHLQVRAKLWPLFSQKLEADTLVVEGLTLNLSKNKFGVNNWDDLTQSTKSTKPTSTKKEVQKKSSSTQNKTSDILSAFALNGIKIKDAQFNWHDKQQNISVKNVQLNLGKLQPDTRIPFEIQFHFQEKTLDAKVDFNTEISFSSNLKQFSFYETILSSNVKSSALKNTLSPKLNSKFIQIDLNKKTFKTKGLNISEGDFKLQAEVSANSILSTPSIKGDIKVGQFNPRILAKRLGIILPELTDDKTLTQLSLELNLNGSLTNIKATNLKFVFDDTLMTGNANIKSTPEISLVNLTVDDINFDRYLPKPSKEHKTLTKNSKPENEATLIPLALLGAFDVNANIKVKKITIKKTHWTDFHLTSYSRAGHIQIKPLNMQGYGSVVQSEFDIKALKNTAALSGKLKIKNIEAGKLLNDLIGKDKLKGKTSITASFNTLGTKLSQLKQNLNGKLKLNLQNATLKGFDLNHQQNVLQAKIKGKTAPAAPKPAETKIANLSASAVIKKGILNNKDLRATTPLARAIGSGTVNIAKEKINYITSVKFTSSTKINSNVPFDKMNSLPLDVRINGTFDKPIVKVDFEKLLKALLKKELKKQENKIKTEIKQDLKKEKTKLKEKLKKDLEKKLGDKLKNLFKF